MSGEDRGILAAVLLPAASLLAVAALTKERAPALVVFAAWVALAVASGTVVVLIGSGDL